MFVSHRVLMGLLEQRDYSHVACCTDSVAKGFEEMLADQDTGPGWLQDLHVAHNMGESGTEFCSNWHRFLFLEPP